MANEEERIAIGSRLDEIKTIVDYAIAEVMSSAAAARLIAALWPAPAEEGAYTPELLAWAERELAEDEALPAKRLARAALSARQPKPAHDAEMDDLRTHRRAWHHALDLARSAAGQSEDGQDDVSYWSHEIKVFNRTFDGLATHDAEVADAAVRRCIEVAEQWTKAAHILLHAGEMTAQELRSVKAIVGAIVAQQRALLTSESTNG